MKKSLFYLIFFLYFLTPIYSGVKAEHDSWMNQIIMGGILEPEISYGNEYQVPIIANQLRIISSDESHKLKILQDTITLTVDQFTPKYGNQKNVDKWIYDELRQEFKNPKWIPSDFQKINFIETPLFHEKPTHLGWEKWRKNEMFNYRKDILKNVVKQIFPTADKKQQENICIFLVDIHVLGDIFGNVLPQRFENGKRKPGSQAASDARMNISELITELKKCISILFLSDSEELIIALNEIEKRSNEILLGQKPKEIDNSIYINKYIKLAGTKIRYNDGYSKSETQENFESIQNILYTLVPDLVSNTEFFQDSFPEMCKLIKQSEKLRKNNSYPELLAS